MHEGRELLDERHEVAAALVPGPLAHARPLLLAVSTLQELGGVDVLAGEHVGDVRDLLAQRLRVDPVLLVEGDLLGAPAVGLVDGLAHIGADRVGVHVDFAGDVAGGAPDGLDEGRRRTEEALLVGVEDGHERDLGKVQALAQQVDADEHVEGAEPELAQQLDPA